MTLCIVCATAKHTHTQLNVNVVESNVVVKPRRKIPGNIPKFLKNAITYIFLLCMNFFFGRMNNLLRSEVSSCQGDLVDYVIPKDERNIGASCSGNGNYIIIVAFVFPTITHNPIPVSIGMILHAICYVCMPLAHHKKKELLGWKSSNLEVDRLRLENLIFSWSFLDKGSPSMWVTRSFCDK